MCDTINTATTPEKYQAFDTTNPNGIGAPFNTTTTYTKVTECVTGTDQTCTWGGEVREVMRLRRCDDGLIKKTVHDRCFPICVTRECKFTQASTNGFFYWDDAFIRFVN
jgi:hypothetical protein